jgi:outer membrane lipoprotein SlyB
MASSVDAVAMGDEEVKDDGVEIDVRKDEGADVV